MKGPGGEAPALHRLHRGAPAIMDDWATHRKHFVKVFPARVQARADRHVRRIDQVEIGQPRDGRHSNRPRQTSHARHPSELRMLQRRFAQQSMDARICTFECTFCAHCADERLANVCPNCGGELVRRPRRPRRNWGNIPRPLSVSTNPMAACGRQPEPKRVTPWEKSPDSWNFNA